MSVETASAADTVEQAIRRAKVDADESSRLFADPIQRRCDGAERCAVKPRELEAIRRIDKFRPCRAT